METCFTKNLIWELLLEPSIRRMHYIYMIVQRVSELLTFFSNITKLILLNANFAKLT